jgi:hypothetical protein
MAKKGFDFVVHKRNSKGAIVAENHYRMVVKDGKTEIERPPGSGIWYDAGGNLLRETSKKADPDHPVFKKDK